MIETSSLLSSPVALVGRTLDAFKINPDEADVANRQQAVIERLRDYIEHIDEAIDRGVGIVAVGSTGAGKDHVVSAVADAVAGKGYSVAYVSGSSLWRALRLEVESEP